MTNSIHFPWVSPSGAFLLEVGIFFLRRSYSHTSAPLTSASRITFRFRTSERPCDHCGIAFVPSQMNRRRRPNMRYCKGFRVLLKPWHDADRSCAAPRWQRKMKRDATGAARCFHASMRIWRSCFYLAHPPFINSLSASFCNGSIRNEFCCSQGNRPVRKLILGFCNNILATQIKHW